jgi:metal-responsive CopG/Arc/MetJ family transcriptional regulator
MKNIVKTSEISREEEYEVIYLPETLVKEIDNAIEQTKICHDRDEFVSSAINKFISTPVKKKIEEHPKKKFLVNTSAVRSHSNTN